MTPDCTLTTCCYDLTKYHSNSRELTECINNMKPLLEIPCYLVIFSDKNCIDLIKEIRNFHGLSSKTHYIVKDFEELKYFKYNELIKENRKKYHPTRDERTCSESHLICCSKFDFVLQTIELNPFNTSKFGWIDSNLGNKFTKICENYTNNMLLYVLNNITEKFHIQILSVCDKKYKEKENKREYYEKYNWLVCGCLFTTGKVVGKKILPRLNEIFEETTHLGYGHGEEMFYLEVLDEFYDDIERSYGEYHNILNNFIKPTKGYRSIYHLVVKKYLNFGYYRECYECCKKLLNEIENYHVEIDYSLYFLLLFCLYVSSFYYKNDESKEIVKYIEKLINDNQSIKNEFKKDEDFYLTQFAFSK